MATKQEHIGAKESNPNFMDWMEGFPPPDNKLLSVQDGSYFEFPALRYSVNHMREFFPSRAVPAGKTGYHEFKVHLDEKIDGLRFFPWGASQEMTWAESLEANYTDGIIILHRGKIVYEKYPAGLEPDGLHAAMSVSKSFTGTLAAILIAEGRLDETKPVAYYLPELKHSGFADATVRQVLDMTTAIQYSEDYNNPNAEVWAFSAAGNVFRPANYHGPKGYYEYLATIEKAQGQKHGEAFGYRTVNTEVMGWIISRLENKGVAQLVSEKIWKPMGAMYDGYYLTDPTGVAYAGGGFNLNLRDMVLFGELMRNHGKMHEKQIIPQAAVMDILNGGDPATFAKSHYTKLKGWSYRDMWWKTNNAHGAYMARGVHGQAIYIDPKAEMVIARFASTYLSSNADIDPLSIPAYEAVASYLAG